MSANEEQHYSKAEIIRKKIFEMYKEMVDAIRFVFNSTWSDHFPIFCFFSEAHFKPIQDEIYAQTRKDVDLKTAIAVFKHGLYESIEHKLTTSWAEHEVDKSLAKLILSKELATDDSKKWRPTSENFKDKIRTAAVATKKKTKAILERQLQFQSKLIEQLVMEVEQERGRLNLQEAQCQNIIEQIERKRGKDEKVAEQIDSIYSACV